MYKVYLLISGTTNKRYKIGSTRRNVINRLNELKTGNSHNLDVLSVYESKWGTKIERALHRKYSSKKIEGEWFLLSEEEVKNFWSDCKKIDDTFEILDHRQNTWVIEKAD
jgi:hypothetical protein